MDGDSNIDNSRSGPPAIAGKRGWTPMKWNAIRHGILAREIIKSGPGQENIEEFKKLLKSLRSDLDPQGVIEEVLVEKIAISYWRLRRVLLWEHWQLNADNSADEDFAKVLPGEVTQAVPGMRVFEFVARYEAAIERQLYRAMCELERRQRQRKGEFVPAPASLTVSGTP